MMDDRDPRSLDKQPKYNVSMSDQNLRDIFIDEILAHENVKVCDVIDNSDGEVELGQILEKTATARAKKEKLDQELSVEEK